MKKLITVLSIIALTACALSLVGCKDYKIRKDWSLTSYVDKEGFLGVEGYEIEKCTAYTEKKLVVPGEYEGKPIVNVNASFPYVHSKSITFSEGIRSIYYLALRENVSHISLPNSLLYFNAYSIENLPNLTYNVKNGVKYLGNKKNPYVYAAGLADETVTDVVLEEGCTAIGSFSGTNIETFTCSSGVEIIPDACFVGCDNLTTVTFGDKTRWVAADAFAGCTNLVEVNGLSQIKYIGYCAFSDCRSLASIALDSAQTILEAAFSGCTSLTEVEVPHTVTEFDTGVFGCCTALKTVRFNATVSVLPEGTFYMVQLKELVLGNAVLEIGKDVLRGSSSTLEKLKLSDAMTTLPAHAFSGYSALKEVNLPASLTAIPHGCFSGCSALAEITLPSRIETIG
ncbi:MAG: leucine-rich repeat domain-containing protein, partial [Clostridia bacterium]|nr:leucine-rich repeat domain-containing protein [Clostridia bacterium]